MLSGRGLPSAGAGCLSDPSAVTSVLLVVASVVVQWQVTVQSLVSFPVAVLESGIWTFLPIDSVFLSGVNPNKAFTMHKACFLLGKKSADFSK